MWRLNHVALGSISLRRFCIPFHRAPCQNRTDLSSLEDWHNTNILIALIVAATGIELTIKGSWDPCVSIASTPQYFAFQERFELSTLCLTSSRSSVWASETLNTYIDSNYDSQIRSLPYFHCTIRAFCTGIEIRTPISQSVAANPSIERCLRVVPNRMVVSCS